MDLHEATVASAADEPIQAFVGLTLTIEACYARGLFQGLSKFGRGVYIAA